MRMLMRSVPVAALAVCSDKLRRRNVSLSRSVATEACRRAENGREFVERVRQETGLVLDIIDPAEEARLAVLGCHILLEDGIGPAVIFDIGGGSTELVLIEPGAPVPRILDWQSVPWGVVSLSETVGDEQEAEPALVPAMKLEDFTMTSISEFFSSSSGVWARTLNSSARFSAASGMMSATARTSRIIDIRYRR